MIIGILKKLNQDQQFMINISVNFSRKNKIRDESLKSFSSSPFWYPIRTPIKILLPTRCAAVAIVTKVRKVDFC